MWECEISTWGNFLCTFWVSSILLVNNSISSYILDRKIRFYLKLCPIARNQSSALASKWLQSLSSLFSVIHKVSRNFSRFTVCQNVIMCSWLLHCASPKYNSYSSFKLITHSLKGKLKQRSFVQALFIPDKKPSQPLDCFNVTPLTRDRVILKRQGSYLLFESMRTIQ